MLEILLTHTSTNICVACLILCCYTQALLDASSPSVLRSWCCARSCPGVCTASTSNRTDTPRSPLSVTSINWNIHCSAWNVYGWDILEIRGRRAIKVIKEQTQKLVLNIKKNKHYKGIPFVWWLHHGNPYLQTLFKFSCLWQRSTQKQYICIYM